jgi:hypothetical protein
MRRDQAAWFAYKTWAVPEAGSPACCPLESWNLRSRSDKEDDPPHEPRGNRPPSTREEVDAEPNAD